MDLEQGNQVISIQEDTHYQLTEQKKKVEQGRNPDKTLEEASNPIKPERNLDRFNTNLENRKNEKLNGKHGEEAKEFIENIQRVIQNTNMMNNLHTTINKIVEYKEGKDGEGKLILIKEEYYDRKHADKASSAFDPYPIN